MKQPLCDRAISQREPVATTQTRQVRVFIKLLMKLNYLTSSYECAGIRQQSGRRFAQRSFFNSGKQGVTNGL